MIMIKQIPHKPNSSPSKTKTSAGPSAHIMTKNNIRNKIRIKWLAVITLLQIIAVALNLL